MVAAEAILEISNSISLGADTPVHSNECRLSPQSSMIYKAIDENLELL